MGEEQRKLGDLISIGPAMLRDFEMMGIRSVAQLAKQNPQRMYRKIGRLTGQWQDPCVLDTFCAAVAQARNPRLAVEKCRWWWWSSMRKKRSEDAKRQRKNRRKRINTEGARCTEATEKRKSA